MARGFNMAFLAAIAIAALIQSSAAQTTYTVGDTTGWTIPPSGAAFYSSWAANKTFNAGDILVFNFMANAHDVAKVTKADYDACTTSSPIDLATTSPARVTLNASGEHYFLCNFTGHCAAGQKLTVNVSAASSPSPSPAPQASSPPPQPSTPTPQSSPAPQPSTPTPQSSPAPQPSTPTPQSSPAPQPSTPTPASSPSPVSTPPPATTPTSGPPAPATTPTPPPAPASDTTPTTTAPPPNSATSLGFAGFTSFLSLFVAFLY